MSESVREYLARLDERYTPEERAALKQRNAWLNDESCDDDCKECS